MLLKHVENKFFVSNTDNISNMDKDSNELLNVSCILKRIQLAAGVTARKYTSVIAAVIHFALCFSSKIPQKLSVSKVA